jgi:hypothetical protein
VIQKRWIEIGQTPERFKPFLRVLSVGFRSIGLQTPSLKGMASKKEAGYEEFAKAIGHCMPGWEKHKDWGETRISAIFKALKAGETSTASIPEPADSGLQKNLSVEDFAR